MFMTCRLLSCPTCYDFQMLKGLSSVHNNARSRRNACSCCSRSAGVRGAAGRGVSTTGEKEGFEVRRFILRYRVI